jgi:hypothetical protein
MQPAAGADSPGEVFPSLFMDLLGVGDVIALRPIANDQAIRRMGQGESIPRSSSSGGGQFPYHCIPLTAVRETRHTPSNVS